MSADTVDRLLQEAAFTVGRYVEQHPGCTIDIQQPDYRGGTNRIILGSCQGQPVVYKYFVTSKRWMHEHSCLCHLASTGIVPRILDAVPKRLLVLEWLAGGDGLGYIADGSATPLHVQRLSRQVGQALGKLAHTPLPAEQDGYSPVRDFTGLHWSPSPSEMLGFYLTTSRRIQSVIPAYADRFCDRSLTLLDAQVTRVDQERQFLFHEDIWNLRVDGDRFVGFYDLEMCRLGTESMQLGVALELCGPDRLDWGHLQRGYEAEVGHHLEEADRIAALAMNHLYHWIRVCRWGEWDGDPQQADLLQASTVDADHYLTRMKAVIHVMGEHVDLARWFGDG
jgi:phosphotransferase family enzyme